MKKLLALILCLLTVTGAFAGCGETADPKETEAKQTEETDDGAEYDENGFLMDHLPEANFGQTEFAVLAYNNGYTEYDIAAKDVKDSIDAAIYRRNSAVEERYNVVFNFVSTPGDFTNQVNYVARVENMSSSGESYDMIGMYSMTGMTLAVKGLLADLLSTETAALDFTNPWWSASLLEQNVITDKLFYATGDISVSYVKQMEVMVYNYEMAANWSITTDPVQDVKNNNWTFARMLEYTNDVYQDLDGVEGKSVNDAFGFIADESTYFDFFSSGFGFDGAFLTVNGKGDMVRGDMFTASGQERTVNIVNKIVTLFNETNSWAGGSVQKDGFEDKSFRNTIKSGNALFTVSVTSGLTNGDFTYDYGILPCPKYDETQENYYSIVTFPAVLYGITKSTASKTKSSIIMEALASEAYRTVVTPLYDVLVKTRFANRSANRDMFDLIRSRITICPSRLLYEELGATDKSITAIFRRKISNNMTNMSSTLAALDIQVEEYLKNTFMPAFRAQ